LEQLQYLRDLLREEREAHRRERADLIVRIQMWNPIPPSPPEKQSQQRGTQGPTLSQDDREAFEYAEKLGKLGLKANPDSDSGAVIEIETGELWESVGEYEAQKAMDAGRLK
jgi:hypothetical protein